MSRFSYLDKSGCYQVDGLNDEKEFQDVCNAMRVVNINESDKLSIFKIIAGILHLGNVTFKSEGNFAQPENLNSNFLN
jgi:myosin heavy subunit